MDLADQVALLDSFGRSVLNALGNGPGYGKRLQMLARQLHSDPQAHARDVAARGDEQCAGWLQDSYDELQGQLSTSAEQHRYWTVLSLDYTPDLMMEAETFGGGDRGLAHVVGRELEALALRLADARLPVVGPVGVAALASLIRNAYSPDHPLDAVAGMRRNRAWPQELEARAQDEVVCRMAEGGEWHHATAAVVAWPQTPVGVGFLSPLLVAMPDVIRTVSVVFTLEANDRALRRVMAETTDDQADSSRSRKLGRVEDPRESRQSAQTTTRGNELAAGAADICSCRSGGHRCGQPEPPHPGVCRSAPNGVGSGFGLRWAICVPGCAKRRAPAATRAIRLTRPGTSSPRSVSATRCWTVSCSPTCGPSKPR